MTVAVFNNDELYILRKIWQDLSERTKEIGINKETFLKYIPMSGLLGDRLFSQFDKNGTGFISYESFIQGLSILCFGKVCEQVKFLFEMCDIDKDGYIQKQDLITIFNYVPSETFCNIDFRKKFIPYSNLSNLEKHNINLDCIDDNSKNNINELNENYITYTNLCYCENAFINHNNYINYNDFLNWIKHTPAVLGYIKNIIPCMTEDDLNIGNNKNFLWKKGEMTGLIIKRFYILKSNCLYYYVNKTDIRPKGIIFLEGSIIQKYKDEEMEEKGYFGFKILHNNIPILNELTHKIENYHHHHEKRIFFCNTEKESDDLVHKLQHLSHVVPFEEDYILEKEIGIGAFSKVHKCTNIKTSKKFAVKIIDKKIFESVSKNHILNEIAILRLVNHPNVIHLENTYENLTHIFIVLELIEDGDFLDYINGKPCFSEECAKKIIKQMLEAVGYLHEFGIVHCDIKPENILYDKNTENIIKLTDFGLSKMIFSSQKIEISRGTVTYIAPEVLSSRGYGIESDLWSIGIILFLLLNGNLPFDGNSDEEVINKINEFKTYYNPTLSIDANDFLIRLLEPNPQKRITTKEALLHPFIKNIL